MTIQELIEWPKPTVGSKEASEILHCDRYLLNLSAKAGRLNIPYFFSGNRLHISKAGLLEFLGYKGGAYDVERSEQETTDGAGHAPLFRSVKAG